MNENYFMDLAIKIAKKGALLNEIPVGAVLVHGIKNKVLSVHHNEVYNKKNPLKHAELLVINEACELNQSRYLDHATIYVTLEPCAMCAAAISEARIKKLYFGAYDQRNGAIENGIRYFSNSYLKTEIYGGIKEKECSLMINNFFSKIRGAN